MVNNIHSAIFVIDGFDFDFSWKKTLLIKSNFPCWVSLLEFSVVQKLVKRNLIERSHWSKEEKLVCD